MDVVKGSYVLQGVKSELEDREDSPSDEETETEYDSQVEPSNFLEVGLTVKAEPADENFFNVDVQEELEDYDPTEYSEEFFRNPKAELNEYFEVSDSAFFFDSHLIRPCIVNVHNGIDSIDIKNCSICKELKETSNNQIEYQCDICLKKFTSKLGLRLHIWHHLNPQTMIIDKKKKKIKAEEEEKEEEDEESFFMECPYCCTEFESHDDLQKHINEIHKVAKSYECIWCSEKFRSRHYLQKHECKVNKTLFECKACKQIFFSKIQLDEHRAAHNSSMFDCETCGKYFYYKSDLTRHLVVHNEPRQFQCSYCPKKYSTKNYLMEHEKNHLGIKRYYCEVCNKNYFWESQYSKHLVGTRHKKMVESVATNVINEGK